MMALLRKFFREWWLPLVILSIGVTTFVISYSTRPTAEEIRRWEAESVARCRARCDGVGLAIRSWSPHDDRHCECGQP